MQRRTIFIIAGSVAGVLALVCLIVGSVSWFVLRRVEQERQRTVDSVATIVAARPTPPLATIPSPPPTLVAAASTSPTPTLPTPTPTSPAATETPTTAITTEPASSTEVVAPPTGSSDVVAASFVAGSKSELARRPGASFYRIGATFDPDRKTITGAETVRYTNTETAPLNEVYFRLYVNAPLYKEGGMTVDQVAVNGAPATTALEVDETALKVALPQPLAPGQQIEISLRFTTTIPTSGGGYGIFNAADGIWALYNWHPEVDVYENSGWLLSPVSEQGDPTNTDAANYEVTFTAPESYTIVASGSEIKPAAAKNGQVAHRLVSGLTRNFVIVASDRFQRATRPIGAVNVSSYYLPANQQGGQAALDAAAKALDLFSRRFGPYPYSEFDVAQVALGGGAAGMESTGLVMIGSELYDQPTSQLGAVGSLVPGIEGMNVLAFTTAHETAHQWWYSVVGSDAYKQPWLDESITNWSSAFYVDETVSKDAGALARDLFIASGYRASLQQGDQRLDQPVDRFNGQSYGRIVYGKGALMYDVLRKELGDDTFFAFLRRYYQEQRFDRADGREWLQVLNAAAGKDMTPFYRKWVEGASITEADLPPGGPFSNLLGGSNTLPLPSPAP